MTDTGRILVLWCPDWPVVAASAAAGVSADVPAAVFEANRVVVCSAVARSRGVRRGMRRRQAQSVCPELAVLGWDQGRDLRLFEPVAAAVEELIVGLEVVRPGVLAVPIGGASGYFGGESALVERLVEHVSTATGVECQVGVAGGLFAALLAARRYRLVPEGGTAEFLSPLSIAELDQPDAGRRELVDLLRRLGLDTLGSFAELGERDVTTRFGSAGALAHRLARGYSERPPDRRQPPPELTVTETFEPVLDRVDAAAFAGRTLAERFHSGLVARGLACTRLGIHATTEVGEELSRSWRCAEPLTAQGVADRVRWQFEAWLRAGERDRPSAGVSWLSLEPEETVRGSSLQQALWPGDSDGEHTPEAERAGRALVRVQGLLGPDGVCTAVLGGGRGPGERVCFVPWGDRGPSPGVEEPWPGRLPTPSPATVFGKPPPAGVTDAAGEPVEPADRHRITAEPLWVSIDGNSPRRVLGWAGPWPVSARWWEPHGQGNRTRIQVVLEGTRSEPDTALLLLWREAADPRWTVEGEYD